MIIWRNLYTQIFVWACVFHMLCCTVTMVICLHDLWKARPKKKKRKKRTVIKKKKLNKEPFLVRKTLSDVDHEIDREFR